MGLSPYFQTGIKMILLLHGILLHISIYRIPDQSPSRPAWAKSRACSVSGKTRPGWSSLAWCGWLTSPRRARCSMCSDARKGGRSDVWMLFKVPWIKGDWWGFFMMIYYWWLMIDDDQWWFMTIVLVMNDQLFHGVIAWYMILMIFERNEPGMWMVSMTFRGFRMMFSMTLLFGAFSCKVFWGTGNCMFWSSKDTGNVGKPTRNHPKFNQKSCHPMSSPKWMFNRHVSCWVYNRRIILPHMQTNWQKMGLTPQPGEIHCRTLPDILREHDMPRVIDWLSLDVERAELEVLDSQLRSAASIGNPFGFWAHSCHSSLLSIVHATLSFGGFKNPCWPYFLIPSFVHTDSNMALETYCVYLQFFVKIIPKRPNTWYFARDWSSQARFFWYESWVYKY